jgi:hypothetical protein
VSEIAALSDLFPYSPLLSMGTNLKPQQIQLVLYSHYSLPYGECVPGNATPVAFWVQHLPW